ncbi:bifunctional lysylphosphatidylglycerol synthetase/lysine--tRNA ligase LysX [Nocardia sp. NPDC024068]|uniref:bifunctional lysylphosphatidylglycerol synthetase/lysine--tRNA ligase LysX n=1 Tax=Nocardia sp. NPDC024068 TaxID=3157197 RepID=UPI0034037134
MIATQEPQHLETPGRSRTPGRFGAIPRVTALISGVLAAACLLWSCSPALSTLLGGPRRYLDHYYLGAPATSLLWAAAAATLAIGLARRKRPAWWALVLYLVSWLPVNLLDIVRHQDRHAAVALLAHLLMLAVLLASRARFGARIRRCSLRPAVTALAAGWVAAAVLGWCLVQAFPGSVVSGGQRVLWVLAGLTVNPVLRTETLAGALPFQVQFTIGLFGVLVFGATAFVLNRTRRDEYALTESDESALRALLDGPDPAGSTDYPTTRRDRSVVFTPNGRAAIGYRVEYGICLALGDPVGARDSWPQAVEAWQRHAQRFGWTVAVIGASESAVPIYRRAGLVPVPAGAEAVLDSRTFSLATPELKPVRAVVTGLRKQGMTVRIRRQRDIPTSELAQLAVFAESRYPGAGERAYPLPLGRLGDRQDGNCLLVEALDADARLLGLLSLVPWGRTGATLELIRRSPDTTEEITDLLIAELALHAEQHGVHRISLNFTVFRSVFEAAGYPAATGPAHGVRSIPGRVAALARGASTVPLAYSRWWQLAQLHRASMRYQPQWVPRFVLCADRRALPAIAVAAAAAEGLLPRFGRKNTAFTHTGTHRAAPDTAVTPPVSTVTVTDPDSVPARDPRPEQVRVRTGKLDRLATADIDPYPLPFPPTHTVAAARRAPRGTTVRVSGRVLRLRDCGGVIFAVVRDWTSDIQLLLDRDRLGTQRCAEFGELVDLGDLVSVSGQLGHSRRGELSLLVADWRMLGKCLRPLPEKWRGLSDPELRMRRGYLDLMTDRDARDLLARRSAVVRSLRDVLHDCGFLEVTTPVLRNSRDGAFTRGMRTHLDADNTDLHLRVSAGLSLKRLCVGGVEKVFELGPGFRNTRADSRHLPEFTLLEAYEAHSDHRRVMTLCRQLIQQAALAANDSLIAMRPTADGSLEAVDLSGEWRVRSMYRALAEEIGAEITPRTELADLRELCEKADIAYQPAWDRGRVAYALYEKLVVETTREPTFYTDFPAGISPFARPRRDDETLAERWDLVAHGIELASGRSELTDPVEQRRRLAERSRLAAGGGPATVELDEDFLCALEYAMPPTGGLSLGVDRVIMLLTGRTIRETQLFPLVRRR